MSKETLKAYMTHCIGIGPRGGEAALYMLDYPMALASPSDVLVRKKGETEAFVFIETTSMHMLSFYSPVPPVLRAGEFEMSTDNGTTWYTCNRTGESS